MPLALLAPTLVQIQCGGQGHRARFPPPLNRASISQAWPPARTHNRPSAPYAPCTLTKRMPWLCLGSSKVRPGGGKAAVSRVARWTQDSQKPGDATRLPTTCAQCSDSGQAPTLGLELTSGNPKATPTPKPLPEPEQKSLARNRNLRRDKKGAHLWNYGGSNEYRRCCCCCCGMPNNFQTPAH